MRGWCYARARTWRGSELVQDDDGGQGTNSRIDTELSAGTYTIEATSFASGESRVRLRSR